MLPSGEIINLGQRSRKKSSEVRRNADDDLIVLFSIPASLELQPPVPAACLGSSGSPWPMPAWFVDEVDGLGAEHMATIPTLAFALATNGTGMRAMALDQAEQMFAT